MEIESWLNRYPDPPEVATTSSRYFSSSSTSSAGQTMPFRNPSTPTQKVVASADEIDPRSDHAQPIHRIGTTPMVYHLRFLTILLVLVTFRSHWLTFLEKIVK